MFLKEKVKYTEGTNLKNDFYSNSTNKFKDMLTLDKELFIDVILNEFTNIGKETNVPLKDINIEDILKYYLNGNGSYSNKISIIRYY